MTEKDAKSQALRVRRNQEGRALLPNSDKHRGFGQDGAAEENFSVRNGGENRSWSDSDCSPRGTTAGGILRQLIEEADGQLAYYESQIEKVTQRREQLQQLYEELQQKAGENEQPQDNP